MYNKLRPWQRVVKGLRKINPYLYWLARLIYSDLGKMIDKLTKVNRIGYMKRLADEIGWDELRFSKNMNKLAEKGFRFTTYFWLHRIGLIKYFIFVNKIIDYNSVFPDIRSWIRSYAKTYTPKGTIIVLHIPYNYMDYLTYIAKKWINDNYGGNIIDFPIIDLVRQPSFTKYTLEEHPLYRGYGCNELEEKFKNAGEEKTEEVKILDYNSLEKEISYPNDIIDLIIIEEFEKDGLITLRDISSYYSLDMGRLRNHLDKHIIERELVKGVFLKRSIYINAFGPPTLLLIKVKGSKLYYKWINFFLSLENTLFIGYSPFKTKTRYLYMVLTGNHKGVNNIKSFIADSATEGFINDFMIFDYMINSIKKFTIPYKNYLQDTKKWDIDIDKTHHLFTRRVLKGLKMPSR